MIAQSPGYAELALAGALIVATAGLSLLLQLGVARQLLVAALRTVAQLLLVGLVLRTVFHLNSPWLVAAVLLAMFLSASYEVWSRQERRFTGLWRFGLGAATMTLATLLVTGFALLTLRPDPWYSPRVVIPLAGIVLGNVMNGVSLSLNAFNAGIVRERAAIEARLALGDTRYAALKAVQKGALRSGLIPIINQMSAAGIITLPGMMTGQILAGMAPLDAAKYQILILLLLSAAAGLGSLATVAVAVWRATDERDRLRLDRLESS